MAPANDDDRLRQAWRALSGHGGQEEGWRTIPILQAGGIRLLAGRHFPGNDEAILVGIEGIRPPSRQQLPSGRGFRVERLDGNRPSETHVWLALARQPAGSLDMFARMAGDVAVLLEGCADTSTDRLFQIFLGRIRAWQTFMEEGREERLSEEAELGLFGELFVLGDLVAHGIPAEAAVTAWQGPLDGLHDFHLGAGVIEVKSSLAAGCFPAKILSAEQLDDTQVGLLFLAAIRLALSPNGRTLPELAAGLIVELSASPPAAAACQNLLLQAGLYDEHSNLYTRRFARLDSRFFAIEAGFPRLIQADLPSAITKVQYVLDLDQVSVPCLDLHALLIRLESH